MNQQSPLINSTRICPSISDLSSIISPDPIECVECSKTFRTRGALRLHRVKLHRVVESEADHRLLRGRNGSVQRSKLKEKEKAYFCPVETCKFNQGQSVNWFRTLANLRQHFGKAHVDKNLICSICQEARFSLEKSLRYHEKKCRDQERCRKESIGDRKMPELIGHPEKPKSSVQTFLIISGPPPILQKAKKSILPKPIQPAKKSTVGTQTCVVERKKISSVSIQLQCDGSDFPITAWTRDVQTDQIYASSSDLDQLSATGYLSSRYETAACQTAAYESLGGTTTAVQSDSVVYNDIFCQTYVPRMTDASVTADFRVSTATSGQQCQLLYPSSESVLMTPPPPFDDQQPSGSGAGTGTEDSNLAWTNMETQTDIAMMELDDMFSYVAWHDMETQT